MTRIPSGTRTRTRVAVITADPAASRAGHVAPHPRVGVRASSDALPRVGTARVEDRWSSGPRERGVVMGLRAAVHDASQHALLATLLGQQLDRPVALQFPNSQLRAADAAHAIFSVGNHEGFPGVSADRVAHFNGEILNVLARSMNVGPIEERLDAAVALARISQQLDDTNLMQRARDKSFAVLNNRLGMETHRDVAARAMFRALPYLGAGYRDRGYLSAVKDVANALLTPRTPVSAETLDLFVSAIERGRFSRLPDDVQRDVLAGLTRASLVTRARDVEGDVLPSFLLDNANATALRAALEFTIVGGYAAESELFNDCSTWLSYCGDALRVRDANEWERTLMHGLEYGALLQPAHEMHDLWTAQLGVYAKNLEALPMTLAASSVRIAHGSAMSHLPHDGLSMMRSAAYGHDEGEAFAAHDAWLGLMESGYAARSTMHQLGTLLDRVRRELPRPVAFRALQLATRVARQAESGVEERMQTRLLEAIRNMAPQRPSVLRVARMERELTSEVRLAQVETLQMLYDYNPAAAAAFLDAVIVRGR